MDPIQKMAYPIIVPEEKFKFESDPTFNLLAGVVSNAAMKTFTFVKNNMHYVLAGVIFNPVLFLHALNALLTVVKKHARLPYMISSYIEPHVDINNNPVHAVMFIVFMVFAQWHAFQYSMSVQSGSDTNQASRVEIDEDSYWEADS